MIDKDKLKAFSVDNYLNHKKVAQAIPFNSNFYLSSKGIRRISEICNQKRIYEILFKDKLNGRTYTEVDAVTFKEWANKGWSEGLYFVFLICESDSVIGAVDIKSNNEDSAEIGYWIDELSPGYMTNAVQGLIKQAKTAGYKALYAHTKIDNDKSAGVLKRNGFKLKGKVEKEPGAIRNKYTLIFN